MTELTTENDVFEAEDARPGPGRYLSEVGVARKLGEHLTRYRHPVIVTGEASGNAFERYIGQPLDHIAPVLRYDGSATVRDAERLADEARELGADAIVAIGAGKLADTAKNVVEFLDAGDDSTVEGVSGVARHVGLIMVPTLAATCASYSALSVNYDDAHRYESAPMHARGSDLVLVDAALVAGGPREFLVSGIGDTLAKWVESAPVFARAGSLGALDLLALRSSLLIRDVLLEHSKAALLAFDRGEPDGHLRTVIDTIIGLGGTVGGFGGERARASGAHAIHDALTRVPGSERTAHGMKVAYGIIVQLLAEGRDGQAAELLPFYRSVELPYTLRAMGLSDDDETLRIVADFAAGPKADFDRAVPKVTPELIVASMKRAETL